jgi:radical SAM superfamily enzyme YgiQ (UPF0313 family)
MKIALINSSYRRVVSSPPLGLLSIAAALVANQHDVKVFDISSDNIQEKVNEIEQFRPELIGFSVSSFQFQSSKELIRILRDKFRKTFFVGGGVHISAIPEFSLRNLNLDCCVIGEGEITFLELCRALSLGKRWGGIDGLAYIDGKRFVMNKSRKLIENLDILPFPARYLLPMEKYLLPGGTVRGKWLDRTTTVMTSRGCPGRCIFCASKILFGRETRRRSVENVIDEIKFLRGVYKVAAIYFLDDTFTLNKRWVMELCKALIDNKLDIKWACQTRAGTIDEDMMAAMKNAGLIQLEFGIESGSEKVLKIIKKDISLRQVKESIELARKYRVKTLVTFILGIPGE